MRIAWLVVGVVACRAASPTAPGAAQSYRDGVQALCDLPDHVPDDGQPYAQRLQAVAQWADANVTNPDARHVGSFEHDLSKERLASAARKAGLLQCKLLDNGMALQSYTDAMKVVCAAPTGDLPAYLHGHLLNPEVIRMVEEFRDLAPADAATRLAEATAEAGIASCPVLGTLDAARFK